MQICRCVLEIDEQSIAMIMQRMQIQVEIVWVCTSENYTLNLEATHVHVECALAFDSVLSSRKLIRPH